MAALVLEPIRVPREASREVQRAFEALNLYLASIQDSVNYLVVTNTDGTDVLTTTGETVKTLAPGRA
jgi:hypothetical protein